jgi:hypothetical protein
MGMPACKDIRDHGHALILLGQEVEVALDPVAEMDDMTGIEIVGLQQQDSFEALDMTVEAFDPTHIEGVTEALQGMVRAK